MNALEELVGIGADAMDCDGSIIHIDKPSKFPGSLLEVDFLEGTIKEWSVANLENPQPDKIHKFKYTLTSS
jgi:hypothetical protein